MKHLVRCWFVKHLVRCWFVFAGGLAGAFLYGCVDPEVLAEPATRYTAIGAALATAAAFTVLEIWEVRDDESP